jgi:translation initiation factor 2 alpha subunit (eIF-2alpha)
MTAYHDGSIGVGFGSNLLNIYELAAAIEDAQNFLKEVNGSEEQYNSIVSDIKERIEVTSSRMTILTNIKELSEEDIEQIEEIIQMKDHLAYRLEWLLFHHKQMKNCGNWK